MPDRLNWLFSTEAGTGLRVSIGVLALAGLAVHDLSRNGREARRWREYAVLLACVIAAMAYGVINDQITSSFSWEFFYYGKGLALALGPDVPPSFGALHWEAAKVGMKATWSAGLIVGVALLLANNPRAGLPRLRYRELLKWAVPILGITAICALLGATAGYLGIFNHMNADFDGLVRDNLWRPRRFIAAWGANLGGYFGGAVGTFVAVAFIIRQRKNGRMNPLDATEK